MSDSKRLVFAYAGPISGLREALSKLNEEGIQWNKENAGSQDRDKHPREGAYLAR